MKCDFEYCIYQREGKCAVDEIRINSLGMCDSCIVVALDESLLDASKQRHLECIEHRSQT